MKRTTPYRDLIQQLLRAMGIENADADDEAILEFDHDGLTSRILPHPDGHSLIIEVELCPINLAERAVNHDRFLLMLQLNGVARLTHGATIFIDDTDLLTISKSVSIAACDGHSLAALLSDLLDRAALLRASWQEIGSSTAAQHAAAAEKSPENELHPLMIDFA